MKSSLYFCYPFVSSAVQFVSLMQRNVYAILPVDRPSIRVSTKVYDLINTFKVYPSEMLCSLLTTPLFLFSQETILEFIRDMFSFERTRYITVDDLAEDIVRLAKERSQEALQRLQLEPT